MSEVKRWKVLSVFAVAVLLPAFCRGEARPEDRVKQLPATPGELMAVFSQDPDLVPLARDTEVLTGGLQAFLLGERVPYVESPFPLIRWAKPYCKGPVRVLMITAVPHYGDAFAVMRRTDIDITFFQTADLFYTRSFTAIMPYINRKAAETLKKSFDVIIVPPAAQYLAKEVQQAIVDKVKGGTGLILMSAYRCGGGPQVRYWIKKDSPFAPFFPVAPRTGVLGIVNSEWVSARPAGAMGGVLAGVPFDVFPPLWVIPASVKEGVTVQATSGPGSMKRTWPWTTEQLKEKFEPLAGARDIPLALTGQVGRGRFVTILWACNSGFPHIERDEYTVGAPNFPEYYASMLAKLILWAANKESGVTVLIREQSTLAAKPVVSVTLENRTGKDADVTVEVALRLPQELPAPRVQTVKFALHAERALTRTVSFAPVAAGRYLVDVIARDGRGATLAWASRTLTLKSPESISVATDRQSYKPGEKVNVSGTVRTAGQPMAGYRVRLALSDSFGRLLHDETVAPDAAGKFARTLDLSHALAVVHKINAALLRQGQPCSTAEVEFFRPSFTWDDFYNIVWPTIWSSCELKEEYYRLQHQTAMTGILASGWMGAAPLHRPIVESGMGLLWTNVCPLSPPEVQQDIVKAREKYDKQRDYDIDWMKRWGALAVCFQDERHSFKDPEPSPACLDMFRAYLKAEYKTLDALNRSWATTWKDWGEVKPTFTKALGPQTTNLAPWMDFRLFISKTTIDVDARHAQEFYKAFPGIRVGIEGLFALGGHLVPFAGFDYSGHRRAFNFLMPYDSENNEVTSLTRSFYGGPLSSWAGYGQTKTHYLNHFWWGLGHGYTGALWFCSSTLMIPGVPEYRQAAWVRESVKPLVEGVGKLVMGASKEPTPIVFLYSQPSLYATWVAGKWIDPKNDHMLLRPANWSRDSLHRLVNDFGLQFGYVSEEMAQKGGLKGRKLLILSSCMALAPETCRAIEAFVQGGGVVFADMAPAVFDDHGRPYGAEEGLCGLFGIQRTRLAFELRPFDYLVGIFEDDPDFRAKGLWLVDEYYEKGIAVKGGKALGKHLFGSEPPAFILNRVGKGKALLMNMLESAYIRQPEHWQQGYFAALLRTCAIEPELRLEDDLGARLFGYDVAPNRDGAARYVSVYRRTASSATNPDVVRLKLPAPVAVYNVRENAWLGVTDRPKVSLRAGEATLLALLPYEIAGVAVQVAPPGKAGEVRISVAVSAVEGKPGRHVCHIDAYGPDGKIRPHYSRNVEAKDGRWSGTLPLALNDPAGAWRVAVREVVSGKTASATFQFKP